MATVRKRNVYKRTTPDKKTEKAVLNFINRCRKKLGKEPITKISKGYKKRPYSCPIARSISDDSYTSVSAQYNSKKKVAFVTFLNLENLPREDGGVMVARFMKRFDEGGYPDLEIKHD